MAAPEPLLATLDIYDRKLGIEREPFETEILLTLDLLDRAHHAKTQNPDRPKAQGNRGNRR